MAAWIRAARTTKDDFIDDKVQFDTLPATWWAWWGSLQPEARLGTFMRLSEPLDWACVHVAGVNGIVSVIVVLLWWGLKLVDEDLGGRKDWLRAVDDVAWAVERINAGDHSAEVHAVDDPAAEPISKKRK